MTDDVVTIDGLRDDPEATLEVLLLINREVPIETVRSWTPEERAAVETWAGRVYMAAADHAIKVPPMPRVLLAAACKAGPDIVTRTLVEAMRRDPDQLLTPSVGGPLPSGSYRCAGGIETPLEEITGPCGWAGVLEVAADVVYVACPSCGGDAEPDVGKGG